MRLFNRKVLKRHIHDAAPAPEAHAQILSAWAESIRDKSIEKQKEVALHSDFKQRIVVDVLGYLAVAAAKDGQWTVSSEHTMGKGAVDLALGNFTNDGSDVLAPFELKGADTKDLDAIMPGRNKTPVQQVWEYANAASGVRWVLVTNYLEIRLYSYSEGNQKYERFEFLKLTDPDEYARFQLLLSAENLLGGKTEALLQESRTAEKDITDELYRDYKAIRDALIDSVRAASPATDAVTSIGYAQTILDRVLFIAFAEDTGLLPQYTLKNAYEHKDPYAPRPVWQTFQALFRAIDEGNPALGIKRYNGGLFQKDAVLDALELPDLVCEGFKRLGEYDFASQISVTILGHIFEQSISDLERQQAIARGEEVEEEKKTGTSGQRKKHGVVYTPDYIARFIVERTVGAHLVDMFNEALAPFIAKDSSADDYEAIKWKRKSAELEAWQAYRVRLQNLKIVDPACGSGAFLVAVFDYLKAEYHRVNTKIADLSKIKMATLFDPDSEILTHNLFGVDVNAESVEITKLSLWLKTARPGKILDSLDHNIRVGDSLIEDSNYAYLEHAFNWKTAFPEVFKDGGFDIALGNPPYVRMELIKPMKPYLEKRFEVVSDRADLYCYFYEQGLNILRDGGRLGYISSSTFFKTGSGKPLRKHLTAKATLLDVIDFGDLQVFEGVTTYPVIMTMRQGAPKRGHTLNFWKLTALSTEDFAAQYAKHAAPYPQDALGEGSWELENTALQALRSKIVDGKPTLKKMFGAACRGIVTGLNDAFIIDRATHDRLIAEDPKSAELLKPFLEGKDLKRWRAEPRDLWIIYIPKNKIDIDEYPAVKAYMLPFKERLEKRATKQAWFELQQAQAAYQMHFESSKIVYLDMANSPPFSIDTAASYTANTAYFIPGSDFYLLAILNSNVSWYFWTGQAAILRGGFIRLFTQNVEITPIPSMDDDERIELGKLAEQCQAAAEARYAIQQGVRQRIPDFCPAGKEPKLNNKLKAWWEFNDFAAFRAQIKSTFKQDIPLAERGDWEKWLLEQKAEVLRLDAEITRLEAEINARVYALFDLTPDEVALLEANI